MVLFIVWNGKYFRLWETERIIEISFQSDKPETFTRDKRETIPKLTKLHSYNEETLKIGMKIPSITFDKLFDFYNRGFKRYIRNWKIIGRLLD